MKAIRKDDGIEHRAPTAIGCVSLSTTLRVVPLSQEGEDYLSRIAWTFAPAFTSKLAARQLGGPKGARALLEKP